MLRAGEPAKVLEKRGYLPEHAKTFSLSVAGERFEVEVRDGRAEAIASSVPDTTDVSLAMTRRGFTAVVLGGLPLVHAVRLGWAIAHPREVRELSPVLDVPAWHTWDRF
jgi:alkyl sulfatase BDS1-like metallo-beta-lactamase superfamily hydrolase